MLHSAMVAMSWLIGLLGIGGAIAAIVAMVWLGPVVVGQIVGPIFARFIACTKCIAAVIGVLAFIGAYWAGHHQAAKECRAEQLRAELRNKQIDLDIEHETAAEAQKARAEIADQASESEKKVAEYAEALKKRPNAACILTDDDFSGGVRKHSGTK